MLHRALPILLLAGLITSSVAAQQCEDFDQCTINDVCFADTCSGTFAPGAGCDDGNACTTNDTCQLDVLSGEVCRGIPATPGTPCGGGCGTCQPIIGSPHLIVCGGDPARNGDACDPGAGACIDGSCFILDGLAGCVPSPRQCPDTDGNPCTDNCDFATDTCRVDAGKCVPTCERCDPATGACESDHLFEACDDGDVCSTLTRCEFDEGAQRTFCVAGVPIGPAPTHTAFPATPTMIAPPTHTQSPSRCAGDCDGSRVVLINEMITGVRMAFGEVPLTRCAAFDRDGSGLVEVHELIAAVEATLEGCA